MVSKMNMSGYQKEDQCKTYNPNSNSYKQFLQKNSFFNRTGKLFRVVWNKRNVDNIACGNVRIFGIDKCFFSECFPIYPNLTESPIR